MEAETPAQKLRYELDLYVGDILDTTNIVDVDHEYKDDGEKRHYYHATLEERVYHKHSFRALFRVDDESRDVEFNQWEHHWERMSEGNMLKWFLIKMLNKFHEVR